jgi:predicted PhzF superfamily epimerase YddE/YHI9
MSNNLRGMVLVVLTLALVSMAVAQKTPALKYDKTTETKISSTIQDVKVEKADNGQERVFLVVKDGADTVEVYVAPKTFLEDMSSDFAKGDQVEITGSKVKIEAGTVVLAREVVKGNNTLVLRDKAGEPVWAWMEKKTAEGK